MVDYYTNTKKHLESKNYTGELRKLEDLKKNNNTIGIIKMYNKYGKPLKEEDSRDITDVKVGDTITNDETGRDFTVEDKISSTKLAVVDSKGNQRIVSAYHYSIKNTPMEEAGNTDIQVKVLQKKELNL